MKNVSSSSSNSSNNRNNKFNRTLPFLFSFASLLILTCCMTAFAVDIKPEELAGDYLLQGVMETASGFRLVSNGTYRFFLSYGSVDEADSGTWQLKDNAIILHSTAAADDPGIEFVRSFKDDFDGVQILFEGEGAVLATAATTIVLQAGSREFHANEGSGHIRRSRSAHSPISGISITFIGAMRSYRQFAFEPQNPTHNNFVFRVTIGNYGSVRFNGARLQVGDNELLLQLPNMRQKFRYIRE